MVMHNVLKLPKSEGKKIEKFKDIKWGKWVLQSHICIAGILS